MVRYQTQWKQAMGSAGFETPTLEYASLLGHEWLSDTLIDMVTEHLRDRTQRQTQPKWKPR